MTTETDDALVALLGLLKTRSYRFVTPTPATHARVVARPSRQVGRTLRDVLGWSSDEVRNALDLTDTNQRVLLHRARAKVRAAVEEHLRSVNT